MGVVMRLVDTAERRDLSQMVEAIMGENQELERERQRDELQNVGA